jgi:hypothetical protein
MEINGDALAELDPISTLISLRALKITGKHIINLRPLSGLAKLRSLIVVGNVLDLGPVSHIEDVKYTPWANRPKFEVFSE